MVQRVQERARGHTNTGLIASSAVLSAVKLLCVEPPVTALLPSIFGAQLLHHLYRALLALTPSGRLRHGQFELDLRSHPASATANLASRRRAAAPSTCHPTFDEQHANETNAFAYRGEEPTRRSRGGADAVRFDASKRLPRSAYRLSALRLFGPRSPSARAEGDAHPEHRSIQVRFNSSSVCQKSGLGRLRRPEKEHLQQLRALRAYLDLPDHRNDIRLVMVGSVRNAGDEARVASLRLTANELGLEARCIHRFFSSRI